MKTLAVLLSPLFARHTHEPGFIERLRRRLRHAWFLHFCLIFSLLILPAGRGVRADEEGGDGSGGAPPEENVLVYEGTERVITVNASALGDTIGLPGATCGIGVHVDQFTQDRFHWSLTGGIVYQNAQSGPLAYAPVTFSVTSGDGWLTGGYSGTNCAGDAGSSFTFGSVASVVTVEVAGATGSLTFDVTPETWTRDHPEGYISASLSAAGSTDNILPGDTRPVQAHVEYTGWWVYVSNYDSTRTRTDDFSTSMAGGAQVTWSVPSGDGTVVNDWSNSQTDGSGNAQTTFTMASSNSTVRADVTFLGSTSTYGMIDLTVDTSEHWQQTGTGQEINGISLSITGGQGSLLPNDQRDITASVMCDSYEIWASNWGNTEHRNHTTIAAPGENVTFTVPIGDGMLSSASVLTDANGNAVATFTMHSSDSRVQADAGGLTATTDFGVAPEVWTQTGTTVYPQTLTLSTSKKDDLFPNETGTVSATVDGIQYNIETSNYGGYREVYAGTGHATDLPITFSADYGGLSLWAGSGTTDSSGVTSVGFTMGASDAIVRATTPDGTYATIALFSHVPVWTSVTQTTITTALGADGGSSSIPAGTSRNVVAQVTFNRWTWNVSDLGDWQYAGFSSGAASGATVTFSVTSGDGSVWPPSPYTVPADWNGNATATFTMGMQDNEVLQAVASYLGTATSSSTLSFSLAPFVPDHTDTALSVALGADPAQATAQVTLETWEYETDGATVRLASHTTGPAGNATVNFVAGGAGALGSGSGSFASQTTVPTSADGSASTPYACGGGGSQSTLTAYVWFLNCSATATLALDSDGDGYSDTLELVWGTDPNNYAYHPAPPSIQPATSPSGPLPDGTLPDGIVGTGYSASLTQMGGIGTLTWSAGGLPPGLNFDPMGPGIYGTPIASGSYTVTVAVSDYYPACYYPATGTKQFTVNIYDPLAITTTSLPDGAVADYYSTPLSASGGTGNYQWSWDAPDPLTLPSTAGPDARVGPPPGLDFGTDGIISGTPGEAGEFWVNVIVNGFTANEGSGAQPIAEQIVNAIMKIKVNPLPVEILIPELYTTATGDIAERTKPVNASKLAIATLENSFKNTDDKPFKDDWIEPDFDRFYIRVTDPSHSGKGPYRVRVWTNTLGVSGYDDDDPDSAQFSQVVELTEAGNTGVFTSESLLLNSNDGDNVQVAFVKRRTFKIALGGKLKIELLEHKPAATHNADIELEVPVEKTVKIKVFVAKVNGVQVTSDADIDTDLKVLQETMAQAGVKIVRTAVVKFNDTDAGIDLSDSDGLKVDVPDVQDAWSLFNWVHARRAADEISYIYISKRKNGTGGLAFRQADFPTAPNYAGHILMEQDQRGRYTVAHEMLHILLNASHKLDLLGRTTPQTDYRSEFEHIRMTWRHKFDDEGLDGSKRISKYTLGRQKDKIIASPYAK